MKKSVILSALLLVASSVSAPAKVRPPDTTITVHVVYLNTSVFPPRIDPAVNASVTLNVLFTGLIRQNFSGTTNANGDLVVPIYYPQPMPSNMAFGANAVFGLLRGSANNSTPLPTNPWMLTVVVS